MLLIYSSKNSPRFKYIFKQILNKFLGLKIDFTHSATDFEAYEGPKFSYDKKPLSNEVFFQSVNLLFDKGIRDIEYVVENSKGMPIMFKVGNKSALNFDIFAACFFMLSRYEEYLPHMRDKHNRFIAEEGMAFKNDILTVPVVDLWVNKLKETLEEKLQIKCPDNRSFRQESTINVSTTYDYKLKGLVRTVGGMLNDLVFLKISNVYDRFVTIFGLRKDPYDGFSFLLWLQKKYNVKLHFFFLVGNYSKYDRNVSYHRMSFRSLIKSLGDTSSIGLLASYYSNLNPNYVKSEKERLENITNFRINSSRMHFVKLQLPETYRYLLDDEIYCDHSMGFADTCGYRAGTAEEFYFYDLDFEIQTPLLVKPFVVNDYALKYYMKLQPKDAHKEIKKYLDYSRKNNTRFASLFHSDSLGRAEEWEGWRSVYSEMVRYSSEGE